MSRYIRALALAGAGLAIVACDSPVATTGPAEQIVATASNQRAGTRTVKMMDRCDPASFNAVLGAGTCVGNGNVTFDKFIRQLEESGVAHTWKNLPPNLTMLAGQTLVAVNIGGEAHTFTEVEEFGGGFIQLLNDLSGNPVPAPECLTLGMTDFIPPGGSAEFLEDEAGTELYQCCLHPWMRTVVRVNETGR